MKVDGACVWEVWLLGNVLLGCLIVGQKECKEVEMHIWLCSREITIHVRGSLVL
jgi:hypothetical protein